ncbi:MAG TPA: hypothetical protein VKY90_00540 [Candidatus Dormibacteraeota bacterium]|nr:hypothetical protein [Candidatus Dormibacteraeota bacterium]
MSPGPSSPAAALPALLAGVALALLAQFPMEPLADASDVWHWIQHGLIFAAGLTVGAAVMTLRRGPLGG